MSLVLYISYIVVSVIWCFVSVLSIIIYFCNTGDDWNKVYENCYERNAKYQYVVRLIFGKHNRSYEFENTTITAEILDPGYNSISKFSFTPKYMQSYVKHEPRPEFKVVKFMLYRRIALEDISYVTMNHNSPGGGTIFVSTFELQNVKSNETNVSPISAKIANLNPKDNLKMAKQMFPFGTIEERKLEEDLRPSSTLNCIEFIVFLFVSFNVILISCVFVIPCSSNNQKFCGDYKDGILSSAFAGLVASIISINCFIITIVIYRYLIKPYYAKRVELFYWIRLIYMISLILVGLICGGLAAYYASNNNKFGAKHDLQPYDNEIYWTLACGIGIIIYVLLWLPCFAIIAYFLGFFGFVTEHRERSSAVREQRKDDVESLNTTKRTHTSTESSGENYYKQVMGKTKVKSVSQYHTASGIKKKSKSKLKQKSTAKVKVAKVGRETKPAAADIEDSTDYYNEIVKSRGNVKSVSQYPGIGK